MSILDYSKFTYSFYYDVLRPKYDDNSKLVYADSYVLKIDTDDVYEDLKDIGEYVDFSDCHPSHLNYDKQIRQR